MMDVETPFVLVAEISVIDTLPLVVESIKKYAPYASIYLVVPDSQFDVFREKEFIAINIVKESTILPAWSIDRVRKKLGKFSHRAGWYYQQFLKLNFGEFLDCEHYVIWDADTVMLQNVNFVVDGKVMMNSSSRFNKPYFDTYKRILRQSETLNISLISQFMYIETNIIREIKSLISKNWSGDDWVKAILDQLPLESPSEFSEYELYGNYIAHKYPDKMKITKEKWFLYGSEIVGDIGNTDLRRLERTFSGYSCVAFERHHRKGFFKTIYARLFFYLKLGC